MIKTTTKTIAFILCAVICASCVFTAYALNENKTKEQKTAAVTETVTADAVKSAKDETVYVLAGADGSVKKIIVSDWIRNAEKAESVTDSTALSNIENVKGDESYTVSGNAKVWDAAGNDIYYQGNIEKELPVGMTVTYTLDGEHISADKISGQSGRVGICFNYDNRQSAKVTIDGKEETIYVPFIMLTGMLLDNDVFRNVEVSNGKLINDGDRTAVIGFALPGIQKNLGIPKTVIDIPDCIEITADVTDFRFGMTVTVATNELFNNFDASALGSVKGLTGQIGELAGGMKQLLDGSSTLYGGITALLNKSEELVKGIETLADGVKTLNDGAEVLDVGAGGLKAGVTDLSNGLNTLKNSNDTLNGGARQVFETMLATAEAELKAKGVSIPALTVENYAEVLNGTIAYLGTTTEAAKPVIALKASLDSYNAFYVGLLTYTAGVKSAADGSAALVAGASDLKKGTAELKSGISALYDGILQIKNGTPALIDGVSQLKNGSMQLNEGLKQFNKNGIQKIVSLVDDDLSGIITRLKATVEVSKSYRNFAGIGEGTDGQVRFIYRTEEIK